MYKNISANCCIQLCYVSRELKVNDDDGKTLKFNEKQRIVSIPAHRSLRTVTYTTVVYQHQTAAAITTTTVVIQTIMQQEVC